MLFWENVDSKTLEFWRLMAIPKGIGEQAPGPHKAGERNIKAFIKQSTLRTTL